MSKLLAFPLEHKKPSPNFCCGASAPPGYRDRRPCPLYRIKSSQRRGTQCAVGKEPVKDILHIPWRGKMLLIRYRTRKQEIKFISSKSGDRNLGQLDRDL